MRILCIADEYPWPATNGLRIRLANVVKGLTEAGDLDLFCTVSDRPDLDRDVTPIEGVGRLLLHPRARYQPSIGQIPAWLRSGWPRSVVWRDWDGPRTALRAWARPPYDIVWYCHCHPWLGLGDDSYGPAVVDLDNLEDEILRRLLDLGTDLDLGRRDSAGIANRARRVVTRAMTRADIRRWQRAQLDATRRAARVVVCSDDDRTRLGHPDAVVIPNGYDAPTRPPVGTTAMDPQLTMVGLFIYDPNVDGAHYFVTQVLPLVRKEVPAARLVIAGRHEGLLDDLASVNGVSVLGEVADLEPVFADSTAVVVPLRSGSGTRIKVLEAFAHRLPVATTTIGCDGIGARDGHEVLIGDTPEALAAACVRLLNDPACARHVADAGHDLWKRQYQWSDIRKRIRDLVAGVAG